MISKEEYKYLFEYTARHYTKYYDVQIEVIDHLASSIDELRSEDPSKGFRVALNEAYKNLPGRDFAKVIVEKEKMLAKYWKKQMNEYLLKYLSWPLVLVLIIFTGGIYSTMSVIDMFDLWKTGLIIFIGVVLIYFLYHYYVYIQLQKNAERYLSIRTYLSVHGSLAVLGISLVYVPDHVASFPTNSMAINILISLLLAVGMLYLYASTVHFPKKIRESVLTKYEHLNPVFN